MSQLRFHVPPKYALGVWAQSAKALNALFALDAHLEHHSEWLRRQATNLGLSPQRGDDAARDARARMNRVLEQVRALRRDIAELVADAEDAMPAGVSRANEVVSDPHLPSLPTAIGPSELRAVQRSYAQGVAVYLREATGALRPLRDRLREFDDEESRGLADRAHEFITAVHGPERP